MEAETRVTPWVAYPNYGLTHYRIWMKLTKFGMWQRHEWRREDGSNSLDGWMPTTGRRWAPDSEPATAEPTDFEAIVSALQRIARGHNDPRFLATETLASIGATA